MKSKLLKIMGLVFAISVVFTLCTLSASAVTTGWQQDENGAWFYYDQDGNVTTGWKHQDKMSDFGLSEDVTLGKKTGYMLWAYASPDIQDSAMVVNLRQNTFVVDVKADSTLQEVTPKEVEKVIGGLFVIPKYEGRGRVQFWLAGVAVKVGQR